MKLLKKADQALNRVQNWILVITGTAITAMILVNAACRFLQIDWFGSEELTMFVAFWLYFVGSACASREDTHISAARRAQAPAYKLPIVISTIPILLSFALWVLYLIRDLMRNIRSLTGGAAQTEKGGE